MIEIAKTLPNAQQIETWLAAQVRTALRPDVSNYAKGRLRVWLGLEPMLYAPFNTRPGLAVDPRVLARLRELIEWDFDYCLVTYSGDDVPVGIGPHMDAGYGDFEARSLHVSGECRFDYWAARPGFGRGPQTISYRVNRETGLVELDGEPAAPSTSLLLPVGAVTKFNCKNPHAASPGVGRWNINFWKKKPPK